LGRPLPRVLKMGEPVPYGIAIAAAMLILNYLGKLAVLA